MDEPQPVAAIVEGTPEEEEFGARARSPVPTKPAGAHIEQLVHLAHLRIVPAFGKQLATLNSVSNSHSQTMFGETFAVDAFSAEPKLVVKGCFVPVIEIYTKSFCPYCWRAKSLLQTKGLEFTEISIDAGGPERERMVQRARGRTTVPQVFIGTTHIGGCDDLLELERAGKLDPLLDEQGT